MNDRHVYRVRDTQGMQDALSAERPIVLIEDRIEIEATLVFNDAVIMCDAGGEIIIAGPGKRPEGALQCGLELRGCVTENLVVHCNGEVGTGVLSFGHLVMGGETWITGWRTKGIACTNSQKSAGAIVSIHNILLASDRIGGHAIAFQADFGSRRGAEVEVREITVNQMSGTIVPSGPFDSTWAAKFAACDRVNVMKLNAGDHGVVFGEGLRDVSLGLSGVRMSNKAHAADPPSDPSYPSDYPQVAFMPDPAWRKNGSWPYPRRIYLDMEDGRA